MPAEQATHWEALVPPTAVDTLPAGQSLQEMAPSASEYMPAGQGAQDVWPAVFWYWPREHWVHTVDPVARKDPGGHLLHVAKGPPVEVVPGAQGRQLAPDLYVPAAHDDTQLARLVDPSSDPDPAGQAAQAVLPGVALYVFAGHRVHSEEPAAAANDPMGH